MFHEGMDARYFRDLFDFNYWARDLVLEACSGLTAEEYARPNGFTYGSIRGILLHTLWAEALWLARWTAEPPVDDFREEDFATRDSMIRKWEVEERKLRAFLNGLDDRALERPVAYRSSRTGNHYEDPLWQLLTHVVNHGTQHRSEAAEALTMAGHSPGDLDVLDYYRERRPA